MKNYIFIFIFIFLPILLYSLTFDDSFVEFEQFRTKSKKFYYPILTINGETGERFAFNPNEDLTEEDYQTEDSYKFYTGYAKILQQIAKNSKLNLLYTIRNKEYDYNKIYNNKSDGVAFSFLYEILPDLTSEFGLYYKKVNFFEKDENDNNQISPEIELKYKEKKLGLFGCKYVYQNIEYSKEEKNWQGNRFLIYWQKGFYDGKFRVRIRYRGENRDYNQPTQQRKSSFKYSVSATAIIDFN